MPVSENLKLGAFLRKDKAQISSDFALMLERFPVLKDRQRQQALTLSGGEQQMPAIACALMGRPEVAFNG